MKVLGVVEWTDRDKRGSPIAGVRPLVELQKSDWRLIDAAEEFPTKGQLFWPNAQGATQDALIIFRREENSGQKDEFKVADPKPAYEVLDLRKYGTAIELRSVLVEGVRYSGPTGVIRVLIWCKPDVLVGPVELNRVATGNVKLTGGNLARVPLFSGDGGAVRSVVVDNVTRWLRVDDGPPLGYVDWDDDATVLRRALEASVRVAKQNGHDTGQTKRQLEEASKVLAAQGVGADAQLDNFRVERARSLLGHTDILIRSSAEFFDLMSNHPAIQDSLKRLTEKTRADVELSARAVAEQWIARERVALKETTEANARAKSQLDQKEQDLRKAEARLAEIQSKIESATKEVEAAVDARILAVLDRPMELLADVSVLRPFFGPDRMRTAHVPVGPAPAKIAWSRLRGEDIKDKASLRRLLTAAARARGVDPELMLQVHAAIVARLLPITLGPRALAALMAYAHVACADRMHIIHVSPGAIQPHDFDEVHGGGLLAATASARDVEGLSLVVLEGANRAPLEGPVVPLLQMSELGMSPLADAGGLRLTASLVAGATTVPVTPQIWSHAAAIYPDSCPAVASSGPAGEIAISSDLLVAGEEPGGAVDALLDAWPDCREIRPTMCRFGSALTRLYDDEPRIRKALLHGLVLPYVSTALPVEEQAEAVSNAGDPDGDVARALLRLRKRLA
jgi:hypothetical protein